MSIISYIFMPVLAFSLALLDTSFFSFYELFGATVISSFCTLIVFSVVGHRKIAILFAAFSILFLSAFSSLPMYVLLLSFLGIPLLIFYARDKIFFETNLAPAILVFFLTTLVFRILLFALNFESDAYSFLSLLVFPAINTTFCVVLFVLMKKISQKSGRL